MPIFPEVGWMIQSQPELSEQAQRALDLKGQLPLQYVDPTLSLSIQADDYTRPEYWYLRRGNLVGYRMFAAANAGFPSVGQFGNIQRGSISVVEKIIVSNGTVAAIAFNIYLAATAIAGFPSGGFARDDRMKNTFGAALGAGLCVSGAFSNAAAPVAPAGGVLSVVVPATSSLVLEVPYVLNGNLFWTIATQLVNGALDCTVLCRERSGLTSEL